MAGRFNLPVVPKGATVFSSLRDEPGRNVNLTPMCRLPEKGVALFAGEVREPPEIGAPLEAPLHRKSARRQRFLRAGRIGFIKANSYYTLRSRSDAQSATTLPNSSNTSSSVLPDLFGTWKL